MKYYAHSLEGTQNKENWHTLQAHLQETGNLAACFAEEFGMENAAKLAGLLHDLGKYSIKFQKRLHGSGEPVDHSTAGAQQVITGVKGMDGIIAELLAHAIAGHHSGLDDSNGHKDRLQKPIEPLSGTWLQEIDVAVGQLWPATFTPNSLPKETRAFQLAFLGRMIFSCLIDADRKDTETFYAQAENRTVDRVWPNLRDHITALIDRFDAHMGRIAEKYDDTPLALLRNHIIGHVRGKASELRGLFTLTVPTGGGKTLASLGFALDHAKAHGLRRIIYAIPFTSIIEQNAAIFREVLGDDYILEHHSAIEETTPKEWEQRDKLRLAMEDWAAPVVVTTNVQLFHSLFSNRPSQCRKLHNLANSVIILDEVQTLPLHLLRPCLAALDELAKHYGATIVLCTATQPAFDIRQFGKGGLVLEGRELAPDPVGLARQLKRVEISTGHTLDDDQVVEQLSAHPQALVIVNSRAHALALYEKAKAAGLDGCVHLSTRQTAVDRQTILKAVRNTLADQLPCRVIATSLIEAGVDIDFPRVWRAETGLDQIAQAAGRCNREGKRDVADSIVTVFTPKDQKPFGEMAQLAAAYGRVAGRFPDLLSPDALTAYFTEVYWQKGEGLDRERILGDFTESAGRFYCNYKTAAKKFQMIEEGPVASVIINTVSNVQQILDKLHNSDASIGSASQHLQKHTVQVPLKYRHALIKYGQLSFHRADLWGDQLAILSDNSLYTQLIGLHWEGAGLLTNNIL